MFLTTRGLYYQPSRDGTIITPATIAPNLFTSVGCAEVVPVAVDEGVVFVSAAGEQVWAATLAGDRNKYWRARHISELHSHLINSPVSLGATSSGARTPEEFVYTKPVDRTH